MRKNKILFGLILSFILVKPIFADEGDCNSTQANCTIKNTAEVLQNYIKNLRTVSQNVTKGINTGGQTSSNSNNSRVEKDAIKIRDKFIKSMNSIINWDTYFSSFNFVKLQLTNEVPYEVVRDRNLLKNEAKNLQRLMESISRKGSTEKIVQNACTSIENCGLDGQTAGYIITELLKNTNKIIVLFDTSFSKESNIDLEEDITNNFILVDDNFKKLFKEKYNQNTLTSCSMCKGFFERAKKDITEIGINMKYSKNAIKKWTDAWAKLQGAINGTTSHQEERLLLSKELARQGVRTSQAEIILTNLDRWNNGGISMDNNPIVNTFKSISDIGKKIAGVTNKILEPFYAAIDKKKDSGGNISPSSLAIEKTKIEEAEKIGKKVSEEYSKLQVLAGNETKGTEEIISEIVQLHANLSDIAKTLNDTIPKARKACFEQGVGMGNCN